MISTRCPQCKQKCLDADLSEEVGYYRDRYRQDAEMPDGSIIADLRWREYKQGGVCGACIAEMKEVSYTLVGIDTEKAAFWDSIQ